MHADDVPCRGAFNIYYAQNYDLIMSEMRENYPDVAQRTEVGDESKYDHAKADDVQKAHNELLEKVKTAATDRFFFLLTEREREKFKALSDHERTARWKALRDAGKLIESEESLAALKETENQHRCATDVKEEENPKREDECE